MPAPLPQTFRLRRPSAAHVRRRTIRTLTAARRHLGPLAVKRVLRRPVDPDDAASRVRDTFGDLGATYVKLGQLVASAPSLFGAEVSDEFRVLLDDGRPVSFPRVAAQVERATGRALHDVFAVLEPDPIGQASMAVVHRGVLVTGEAVAVKILRPGIERKVAADLALLRRIAPLFARRFGDGQGAAVEPMIDGLRDQLCEELDLRNEARIMDHFNGLLGEVDLPSIAVPRTYPDLSSRRVLVMEYLDGVAVDDLSSVADLGIDPTPLVADIVKAFFLTAVRFGLFHGDVHAGNLLILHDGRVGILDWGIVGRLDERNRRHFADIIRAALGDETAWRRVTDRIIDEMGPLIQDRLGVEGDQLAPLIRSVLEPMFTRPFGEVKLSTLLLGPEELAGDRALRDVSGPGVALPDPEQFDRNMMLLAKQLLYFERYGQLYLRDHALLADKAFFEALVGLRP